MPEPRAHVETHVRVVLAYTGTFLRAHGDVLNLHTGAGSSSVLLAKICSRRLITSLQRFTKEPLGPFPFSSLRIGREQHVPDSSNHSLYLMKLLSSTYPEGGVGGNQL